METFGWLSSALLAACAIPAAREAFRIKRVQVSKEFLRMWLLGEILGIPYACWLGSWPLLINYSVNLACILVLIKYNQKVE